MLSSRWPVWLQNGIKIIWLGLAGLAVGRFLYVAALRLAYPFTLEWVEADTYLHVWRVLHGLPIYVAPSYDFIPMIYTPLYYYVSAAVAALSGRIILSMRLVSLLATLATLGLLYLIARQRGVGRTASLAAAGLFAAAYGLAGFWFDVSRVDMLFLALTLGSLACAWSRPAPGAWDWRGLAAGLLLSAAFAAKQSALIVLPCWAVALWLAHKGWPRVAWFVGSALLVTGGYVGLASLASGGWFGFYVFTAPAAAPIMPNVLVEFWTVHLGPHYAWTLALLVSLGLSRALRRSPAERWAWLRPLLAAAGLYAPFLLLSLTSMAKQWGYLNGLLPAAAALALLAAEAYHHLTNPLAAPVAPCSTLDALRLTIAALLLIAQFAALWYDLRPQIPTPANLQAGQRLLELVRTAPGPVFAPTAVYLLDLAGRPMHFHTSAQGDLGTAAQHNPAVQALYDQYKAQIIGPLASGQIATAILPDAGWYDGRFSPEKGYTCTSLLVDGQGLASLTGAPQVLNRICRRSP
jgi:4-amino-4-deoxy-L-arabinose transferase-like glycosyltransferase